MKGPNALIVALDEDFHAPRVSTQSPGRAAQSAKSPRARAKRRALAGFVGVALIAIVAGAMAMWVAGGGKMTARDNLLLWGIVAVGIGFPIASWVYLTRWVREIRSSEVL